MSAFCCITSLALGLSTAGATLPAQPVEDFVLRDHRGVELRLIDGTEARLTVLVFLGTDCPLVKLYAPRLVELERAYRDRGVRFLGVNANHQDGPTAIADFVRTHNIPFPVLHDVGNGVADRLSAQRTPEVFLLDRDRVVRYRGRIDDQYSVGQHRPRPTRRDLAIALDDLLAGRPVQMPRTESAGCLIGRVRKPADDGTVTFTRHVAPLLYKHCVACHRPGSIAPFSLLTYRQAAGWAETMEEVVAAGRMPPWSANPEHGKFANDARLTDAEKRLLSQWIKQGLPEGEPGDLPKPPVFADAWRIPTPDLVLSIPQEFHIPAEGVVDYQYFEVDPGFREDKWVQAAEVRPGNRAVVHHCVVFLKPPGSRHMTTQGDLESVYLLGSSAGSVPLQLPTGMAKKIPAGWKLLFQVHYTTTGSPQRDRTSLGLVFADPKTVQKEVATNMLYNHDLCLPPHAADVRVEASNRLEHDVLLLSLAPHMHMRGKSFRYEAHYPDGRQEVLLDVPRFDFNWQLTYQLAAPKLLPRGTVLHARAHFDNSAGNFANPDPTATVKWGQQTWDEMMIGYYNIVRVDEDLTKPTPFYLAAWKAVQRQGRTIGYAFCVLAGLWLLWRYVRWRMMLNPASA